MYICVYLYIYIYILVSRQRMKTNSCVLRRVHVQLSSHGAVCMDKNRHAMLYDSSS